MKLIGSVATAPLQRTYPQRVALSHISTTEHLTRDGYPAPFPNPRGSLSPFDRQDALRRILCLGRTPPTSTALVLASVGYQAISSSCSRVVPRNQRESREIAFAGKPTRGGRIYCAPGVESPSHCTATGNLHSLDFNDRFYNRFLDFRCQFDLFRESKTFDTSESSFSLPAEICVITFFASPDTVNSM